MQVRRQTMGPWSCLWLLAVVMLETTAAYSDFCQKPANMEICYGSQSLSKRFLRFGRALTDDPFLRFGRNMMDKRFLRFGRSDADTNLDNMIRLAIARADAEDVPLYLRKKRSTTETSPDSPKAVASSQHPEGMAKREADDDDNMSEDKRFMRFGKRFMRFGRNPEDGQDSTDDEATQKDKKFMRFGKRFMRFGRGGQDEGDLSEDKRFMRFGKRFMRFGREPMEAEKRFMRFGRSSEDAEGTKAEDKRFMRFGKRFMRFGKSSSGEASESKSEQPSS